MIEYFKKNFFRSKIADLPPGANLAEAEGGGGPSTAIFTTFSPRIRTNPRLLFSVLSSNNPTPLLLFKMRNSSASLRTRFKCLSNARKVPTMVRLSCRVTLNRCSTYLKSLLPLPVGYFDAAINSIGNDDEN